MKRGRGIDHELRVGSTAHYDDPAYYAQTYRDRRDDVSYYVSRARDANGAVLEYGCGSGRITIPMARGGAKVLGVDLSQPMLDELQRRLASEPSDVRKRVTVAHGDMRTFRTTKKHALVLCTFNTFLHLYARQDVEQFLARVKGHLARGGRFVFDTSVPIPLDLARDPNKAFRTPPLRHPTHGVKYAYAERFDYDPIRQILFVAMEFEPTDGSGGAFMTPLAHRQFFPAELEALLHYNGFAIEKREGGYAGEPIDRHTDTIVWTCVPR